MQAQTIYPSVFNAGGGYGRIIYSADTTIVHYSIGETIMDDAVTSPSQVRMTQGFLQPDLKMNGGMLQVNTYTTPITCHDANNAAIVLNASGSLLPFHYTWYKNGNQLNDSTNALYSLSPGSYVFLVSDAGGHQSTDTIEIENSNGLCLIQVNNAFTPNGDGTNDHFQIGNIEEFPGNKVSIFNRWGNLVWDTREYNNLSNAWKGTDRSGHQLPAGTYFYIVDVDGKINKGWVELLR